MPGAAPPPAVPPAVVLLAVVLMCRPNHVFLSVHGHHHPLGNSGVPGVWENGRPDHPPYDIRTLAAEQHGPGKFIMSVPTIEVRCEWPWSLALTINISPLHCVECASQPATSYRCTHPPKPQQEAQLKVQQRLQRKRLFAALPWLLELIDYERLSALLDVGAPGAADLASQASD